MRLTIPFIAVVVLLTITNFVSGASCFLDTTRIPVVEYCPASRSNFSGETRSAEEINYIVIHTVQGSMKSAVGTFGSSDLSYPRSAHFTIGSSGEVIKSVPVEKVAWHAGTSPLGSGGDHESRVLNSNSIGIEHGGYVDDPNFPTREQYFTSAALTRYLCELYDIPMNRRHIVGHEEIKSTKGDPGPNWDWDYYMNLVRNGSRKGVREATKPTPRTGSSGSNLITTGFIAAGAVIAAFGLVNIYF